MKLLFLFLSVFSLFNLENSKEALESNIVINDVNKPLSQNDICRIIDFKIVIDNKISDLEVLLIYDEYKDNEINLGVFKQVYQVIYENKKYDCTITIYNMDLKGNIISKKIEISTNCDNFLSEAIILEMISENLGIEIFSYVIKENNYFNDNKKGSYNQMILITSKTNKVFEVNLTINVGKNKRSYIYGLGVFLVGLSVLITIIIKRKRIKNGKEN